MTETSYTKMPDPDRLVREISYSSEDPPRYRLDASPSAKMLTEVRDRLERRLQAGPMSWRVLALEWRYDIALLLDHWRHWIFDVDRAFNRERL